MSLARRLGATYRVQLGPQLGFAGAAAAVPYLAHLGIETLYCSPVAEAVPGSTHGYDGTDPARLRQELGGEDGFARMVEACESEGLGLCVDHVPNHLATWHRGPWWRQLLAEGRRSEMAELFDVDWDAGPPGRPGKVTLPLLDRPLEQVLEAGALYLDERTRSPVVVVGDVDLPVAGGTVRPGEDVAEVLAAQHYRLVDWHDAADRNYRRFFDIDGLVGVRVEVPEVFARTHALVVALAQGGRLSAIRVDHVDGLREPTAYLRRLAEATQVPIVVEKILTGDEELRQDWPVVGTTGYETVDDLGGLLVDADGTDALVASGRAEGDEPVGRLTVATRRLVARASFTGELERCAGQLGVAATGLEEAVVRLPRYRTYLEPLGPAPEDAEVWESAAGEDPGRRGVLAAVLDPARRPAVLGVQQLTGAIMAKGVEDTAWYRLAGPLAFCEVGGDPGRERHGGDARWHERAARRAASGRSGLVPGTTHDTKRAQDVRCRLYALSERAADFERALAEVRRALGLAGDGGPLAFETRVALQLGLAMLPPLREGDGPGDAPSPGDDRLVERLGDALVKGAREAKQRSSWREPDPAYEAQLRHLAEALLGRGAALVRTACGELVDEVARLGAVGSLTSVVLRAAAPGIPDCYQGDEAWNLSLVDPDNRRPVDFGRLAGALEGLGGRSGDLDPAALADLRRGWRDGRVKLWVTARCLWARREAQGALEPTAAYRALGVEGPAAGSVVAFSRGGAGAGPTVVAVGARRAGALGGCAGDLPVGEAFAATALSLPAGTPPVLVDTLSGAEHHAGDGTLGLDAVLGTLPVALLVGRPA